MAGNENGGISSVDTLLAGYKQLNFFKRWFFPGRLESALAGYESATNKNDAAFTVYQMYFAHTNFITRWLFTCLNLFKTTYLTEKLQPLTDQPEEFRSTFLLYTYNFIELIKINFETLFCGEHAYKNTEILSKSASQHMYQNLTQIKELGLLEGEYAQEYFKRLASSSLSNNSPASFLIDLSTGNQLPQDQEKTYEYFLVACHATDLLFLQEAKKLLLKFELLSPAHLGALATSIDSFNTSSNIEFILENLLKVNSLKGNETIYLQKVIKSSDKTKLREAFEILISTHSFQKDYIDKLLDPNQFTHFFCKLTDCKQQNRLSSNEIQTIFQEPIPTSVSNKTPTSPTQTPYNHFQGVRKPSSAPIHTQNESLSRN